MENTPLVCLTCLDTGSTMCSMREYKLQQAYEHLTGYPLFELNNLEHTLCMACTQTLKTLERFRDKSLRARALMMELVQQQKVITTQHLAALIAGAWAPDTVCNLHVEWGGLDAATPMNSEGSAQSHFLERTAAAEVFVKTEPLLEVAWDSAYVKSDGSVGEATGISDSLWVARTVTKDNTNNMETIKTEQDETNNDYEQEFNIDIELLNLHTDNIKQEQGTDTPSNTVLGTTYDAQIQLYKSQLEVNELLVKKQKTNRVSKLAAKKSFDCQRCSYKCLKISILKRHMKSHFEEQTFQCDYCQYTTKRRGALVKHIRKHTGEKPFSCQFCSYKCGRQCNLARHMRIHTGEKPYACNVCPYRCSDKSHLVSHMRRHTGEKPFSCNFCPNRYSERSYLAEHVRSHSGERPFNCHLCTYSCSRKSNLVRHGRTHTGERPYACMVCTYKAADRSTLVSHMRKHK